MTVSKKPYKGTRDFFPKEKRIRDYIFKKMASSAELFGYQSYDGPILEEVELYLAKSGEELVTDQVYSFHDRGKRFVSIRPEMTPTVARMVAQVHREIPKPIRWYSIPNLMRYEKPQRGRLREFWQFNCDIFGATSPYGELEIIQVATKLLESLGANEQHFEILINDRKIVDELFSNVLKLNEQKQLELYKIVDKSQKVSFDKLTEMVKEIGIEKKLEEIFYEYLKIADLATLENFLQKNKIEHSFDSIKTLIENADNCNISKYIKYRPDIVRGLDYYTGIVFEIFDKHPDNRRAICGGGAFDNLLSIFNEDKVPGVGLGLGEVPLTDFLKSHDLLPNLDTPTNDIFISFQVENALESASMLASNLRSNDIKTIINFTLLKFKKVFALAEKQGSKFVCLIGENELKNKSVIVKNLSTKEQKDFPIQNIDQITKYIKG